MKNKLLTKVEEQAENAWEVPQIRMRQTQEKLLGSNLDRRRKRAH